MLLRTMRSLTGSRLACVSGPMVSASVYRNRGTRREEGKELFLSQLPPLGDFSPYGTLRVKYSSMSLEIHPKIR